MDPLALKGFDDICSWQIFHSMGPCIVCFYVVRGEDVVTAFKWKSGNISYVRVIFLWELGRAGDCFTLGYFGVVVNSPSLGGGDSLMARFLSLVSVMMLYWFLMRQHKNILWSSSGMNFLPLLHCFSSGVSPGQRSCNIYISWWIYSSSRSLVRAIRVSCDGYVEGYGFFRIEDSCVRDSKYGVYVGVLFWYISVGCGIVM